VQGVRGTGPQSRLPRTGTMRITTRTRGVTRKWGLVAGVRGSRRPGQGSPRTANAILLPAAWADHPWGRNHPHPGGQGRCRRSAVPERDRLDLERDRPILERIGSALRTCWAGSATPTVCGRDQAAETFRSHPPTGGLYAYQGTPGRETGHTRRVPCEGQRQQGAGRRPIRPRRGRRPRPPSNTGNLAAAPLAPATLTPIFSAHAESEREMKLLRGESRREKLSPSFRNQGPATPELRRKPDARAR